jgi:hypothetical protein
MACLEGDADLALRLEAADPGTMTGTRIDDDEGPLLVVDLHAFRRRDAGQHVVDRTRKLASVHHQLGAEFENVWSGLGGVLLVLLAPLLQDVEKKNPSLPSINPVRPCVQNGIGRPWDRGRRQLGLNFLTDHRIGPPRNSKCAQATNGHLEPNQTPHSLDN